MATKKPKITRLGDPNNPYTPKKVTAAQAAESAKQSRVTTPPEKPRPTPKPSVGAKVKAGLGKVSDALNPEKRFGPAAQRGMKKANEEYGGGAMKRARDAQIKRAGG